MQVQEEQESVLLRAVLNIVANKVQHGMNLKTKENFKTKSFRNIYQIPILLKEQVFTLIENLILDNGFY